MCIGTRNLALPLVVGHDEEGLEVGVHDHFVERGTWFMIGPLRCTLTFFGRTCHKIKPHDTNVSTIVNP